MQYAYEIKLGATFSKEYFKGLDYWAKFAGTRADRKTIIYGGEKSMNTSDGSVTAWYDM